MGGEKSRVGGERTWKEGVGGESAGENRSERREEYCVSRQHFSVVGFAKGAEDLYSDGGEGNLSVF